MSMNLLAAKDRLSKFKYKLTETLRGHVDAEDSKIYLNLIEKNLQETASDVENFKNQIADLKAERDFLKNQLKRQSSEIENLSVIKKVVKECLSLYKKIIYSERFINKDLLKKAQAATTLLEVSTQEKSSEEIIQKKINIYS